MCFALYLWLLLRPVDGFDDASDPFHIAAGNFANFLLGHPEMPSCAIRRSLTSSVVGSVCFFFPFFMAIVFVLTLALSIRLVRTDFLALPALCLAQRHQLNPNGVTASAEQCGNVLWLQARLVEQCYLLSLLHVPGRKDG